MLPQTLPQWVEQTPSVMADGSLWLGSRHTHAFFVDGKTGKLIKSYVEYGDGPSVGSADVAGEKAARSYKATTPSATLRRSCNRHHCPAGFAAILQSLNPP